MPEHSYSSGPVELPPPFGGALSRFITASRRLLFVLAIGALFLACVGRYWMHFDASREVPRKMEMSRTAINLYEKGEFANPFYLADTGPTAHVAPAFPAYMALLMYGFGDGAEGLFALKVSVVLTVALLVALFPVFSQCLGMGRVAGFVASFAWIVAKPQLEWNWEGYYAALLVAITCGVYRKHLDLTSKQSRWITYLLGLLTGILMLLIPTAALVLSGWIGFEIWRSKGDFWRACFLPLIILPVLIVSPWLVRNYLVFHRLSLRDNFGLELATSNRDCAQFAARINFDSGCFDSSHPNGSLIEARKVAQMGEVRYNDQRLREGMKWIEGHPVRFLKLVGIRFVAFWFPTETANIHYAGTGRRLERLIIYLMTLLSIAGVWMLYRRDNKSAYICLSCLVLYPLVYYVMQFIDRYRYPILWLSFLLGSLAITNLLGKVFDHRKGIV
jgi:hypothetical protein